MNRKVYVGMRVVRAMLLCGAVAMALAGDPARSAAQVALCGNETVEAGEECDDGGQQDGDCCSADCQFEAQGSPCPDENWCNGSETCNGTGQCQPSTPPDCNDDNPCTNDVCNSLQQNCMHVANDNACDDGDPCTVGDTCGSSQCQPGSQPLDCGDGNECTDDSCTAFVGCQYANNSNPCSDGDACTTGTQCSGGQCVGGSPVVCNDADACTTDSCDSLSGCFFDVTVESPACGTCEDGSDNDADDDLDAEDEGCATLATLQRFAVVARKPSGNDLIYSGSDVIVASAGGNQNVPYPLGPSRAGVCANVMDIRAGTTVGIMAVDTKVSFGQGSTLERDIDVREEFVSDAVQVQLKTKAPYVGPGSCSNNAMQSCVADDQCGMGTCDGRLRLNANPANPFVDMTGAADNLDRCRNAIAEMEALGAAVAQIDGTPAGVLLGTPGDNDVFTNAATPSLQLTFGSGVHAVELRDLHLGPATQLTLVGQADTTLVLRVARKFRLGAAAKVVLQGGLTADHVLWNVEGTAGGHPDLAGDSEFAGTILAPKRSLIRTGTAVVVDGALYGNKVHLSADTTVSHEPFTPLVP